MEFYTVFGLIYQESGQTIMKCICLIEHFYLFKEWTYHWYLPHVTDRYWINQYCYYLRVFYLIYPRACVLKNSFLNKSYSLHFKGHFFKTKEIQAFWLIPWLCIYTHKMYYCSETSSISYPEPTLSTFICSY